MTAATQSPVTTAEVAAAARLLAAAGLVEGFGHVSARTSTGFAISSTAPLMDADPESVIACDAAGEPRGDGEGLPLETPLHAAVYAARDDVGAIARIHGRAVAAVGAGSSVPGVAHGLGGLSGAVATWDDPQLVTDPQRAGAGAAALGASDCLLIRGNGAVATGPDLGVAAVRAWYLEERCRVWAEAGASLSPGELEERSTHYEAETARAWRWLQRRYGRIGGEG
ncbi:MAG: class II aldolase/adducin family protein [Solirubrobacterales bacterium]|nr:class II aldolase/adducin family protein [Solirubrobacterales bacterium]